jgi:hypothetical protein
MSFPTVTVLPLQSTTVVSGTTTSPINPRLSFVLSSLSAIPTAPPLGGDGAGGNGSEEDSSGNKIVNSASLYRTFSFY